MGLKDVEVYKYNPFDRREIHTVYKRVKSRGFELVDKDTGEVHEFGTDADFGFFDLDKKKFTKVIEDIDSILRVISLTQKSLSYFKQYLTVQEIVSVLETNKTLLELYRKKYTDKLEELNKNDKV